MSFSLVFVYKQDQSDQTKRLPEWRINRSPVAQIPPDSDDEKSWIRPIFIGFQRVYFAFLAHFFIAVALSARFVILEHNDRMALEDRPDAFSR